MPYHRIIPVLLYDNGRIFRSQAFVRHFDLGDPFQQLERYKVWDVDEIVYLDMCRTAGGRRILSDLPAIARNCFAPLAIGGGLRTLDDISGHLEAGADRVAINSAAVADPQFVTEAARRFGAQAIIVSIDAKLRPDGRYEVMSEHGTRATGRDAEDWADEAAERGAGEIFLNSIDRDGLAAGYDLDLLRRVTARVSVPVIACGGVGRFDDFAAAIREGGASSAAAANIFCFKEHSYFLAKDAMTRAGLAVRASRPGSAFRGDAAVVPIPRDG